ncbi:MAG: hypothetical protein EXQ88_00900 [Alphaproteobacteria bacterium]|nr:hypothetical protein [Alphaproteobacteria bacterium]
MPKGSPSHPSIAERSEQPSLQQALFDAHNILTAYVKVHDAIFKFSIRKVLPIPGLFQKIDYESHVAKLTILASDLERVGKSADFYQQPPVFLEFVLALLSTILHLRDICIQMVAKIQGIGDYPMAKYKRDFEAYKALVNRYASLGATLNTQIGGSRG